jgi:NAD(P)-dependent dehydrogenase (short-subunit alcohol dehydrogenase family)
MPDASKAYVVTGPTSGIGYRAALEPAKSGTIVLVARNRAKLDKVRTTIEQRGGAAVCVVCDFSDVASVRRAAAEIIALDLPLAGLLNNAGMREPTPTRNALGWDMTFATNHVGPFALTEALAPQLPDGANVVFVVSAVENPERQPAKSVGFRGGRYISAEACARGEWLAGGSTVSGFDSYATSKQANLATVLAFARQMPRLRFNAVEPGVTPATGLAGDSAAARFMTGYVVPLIVPLLMPFMKFLSTPQRAGRVLARVMIEGADKTAVYYDESGHPMQGSELVRDPAFQDRVVAETRTLLARTPA